MLTLLMILFIILLSSGMYFFFADCFKVPTYKQSKAMLDISRQGRRKPEPFEAVITFLSIRVARLIKIESYKHGKLVVQLKSADVDLTPEVFVSKAYIKAGLSALLIIPAIATFPITAIVPVFLSVALYFKDIKSLDDALKEKQKAIEAELPRFVSTLAQMSLHSRDVLAMLESYKKHAGRIFKRELEITCADMRSSS